MVNRPNSTTMDLAFSIPQVVASISQSLSHHDLTNCVRVCRDWNQIFSFEFVRRDNGQGHIRGVLLFQEGRTFLKITSRSLKSKDRMIGQEVMALNHLVGEWMESEAQTAACIRNFKSYVSDDEGQGSDSDTDDKANVAGGSKVVDKHNSRVSRILRHRLLPYTYMEIYWFERVEASGQWSQNIKLDQVLELMTDTILALELKLVDEMYITLQDPNVDLPLPATFPKRMGRRRALTSLTLNISTHVASISDALDRFLEECPDLRRFSILEIEDDTDIDELSRLLKKNCPKVTDFSFQGSWDMEAMVELFPCPASSPTATNPRGEVQERQMDNGGQHQQQQQPLQRGLRSFSFTNANGSSSGILARALQSHCSTLESVEIDGLRIISEEIQVLLIQCPRLEHLSINKTEIDEEFVSVLEISSFHPSTPWACLGLKSICLEIGDGCEYPGDCAGWERNQQDVLTIYQRLSQLTALESIQLGFSHCDSIRRRTAISGLGFNFSLSSGLDLLKTLKKLKKLAFFRYVEYGHWMIPAIGQAEVEWMAEHWPELQELQLNIRQPEEGSTEAEKWRWLKEARPEVKVLFLP